jgi:hypothetical protein
MDELLKYKYLHVHCSNISCRKYFVISFIQYRKYFVIINFVVLSDYAITKISRFMVVRFKFVVADRTDSTPYHQM